MKFTKMSLVAALLIGSSAFALDNIKVSGDAKLYYSTNDIDYATAGTQNTSAGLFNKSTSIGQAALGLGVTADLAKGISAGTHLTVLTTLGLEHNLVEGVWENPNGLQDSYILDEAWIAATLGKTTAKVGRMQLDTPIVFSEKWSVATNTFGAAVLINQDIPDTTLIAAFVGTTDSNNIVNPVTGGTRETNSLKTGFGNGTGTLQKVSANGNTNFSQFYNGAFAVAAINNSFKPLTVQAWYYNAPGYLDAYWLQADLNIDGILVGAQYDKTNYTKTPTLPITASSDNDVYAFMVGYAMKDVVTVKAAFSQVGTEKKSTLGLGAGGNLAGTQSKLYTESWWTLGRVAVADAKAYSLSAEASVAGIDLGAYYTSVSVGNNGAIGNANNDLDELAITASKSFGPLDATLAYINTNDESQNRSSAIDPTSSSAFNTIQAYLTVNF